MNKQLIDLLPVLVPALYCTLSFLAGGVLAGIIWYYKGYKKGSSKVFLQGRQNKGRKFGSATFYWYLKDGSSKYLFTNNELVDAAIRANRNPEDCK